MSYPLMLVDANKSNLFGSNLSKDFLLILFKQYNAKSLSGVSICSGI